MPQDRPYHQLLSEFLVELAPDYAEARRAEIQTVLLHGCEDDATGLPVAYRELVMACVCAACGAPQDGIERHAARAMELGLSERDLAWGFIAGARPAGSLSLLAGVRALLALRERREKS
jgi:hypothetical protein